MQQLAHALVERLLLVGTDPDWRLVLGHLGLVAGAHADDALLDLIVLSLLRLRSAVASRAAAASSSFSG